MSELLGRLKALARNKAAVNAALAVAVAFAVALLAMLAVDNVSFLTSADRFVRDWEIAFQSPPEDQDPNILILSVNEQTMQNFPYRSPLDRAFLAGLLTTLDAKHPKAIVVDYLFDQPTETAKDDALKSALLGLKTPTVVSYFEANTTVSKDQIAYLVRALLSMRRVPSADAADALAIAICHARCAIDPVFAPAAARRKARP